MQKQDMKQKEEIEQLQKEVRQLKRQNTKALENIKKQQEEVVKPLIIQFKQKSDDL